MPSLATLTLNTAWLRRVRAAVTSPELSKAEALADSEVQSYIRMLFTASSLDEEVNDIVDDDEEVINVADEVYADLVAHPTDSGYKPFITLAELWGSRFVISWMDFVGDADQSGETSQFANIDNEVGRVKRVIENVGYVALHSGTLRYIQQRTMSRGVTTIRRRERR